jgi:hypothetical protein
MQGPRYIINVVDVDVEERRDKILAQKAGANRGRRGQPPMVDRLRALTIYVEWLLAGGVMVATYGEIDEISFGVGPKSVMNRVAGGWLNERYARSRDDRKSRCPRKQLKPDGTRAGLRQVRELRKRSA